MAKMSSSSRGGEEESSFRSLLPHEPVPLRDERGYVLLQGAFSPRHVDADGRAGAVVEDYWTRATLERCLHEALTTDEAAASVGLPWPAVRVRVLQESPPFTQARLTFATPRQARDVVWHTRQRQPHVSLARLVAVGSSHDKHQSDNDAIVVFPTKALQWTRLTRQPQPTVGWTRSSPPKFRRLLPKPGEDLETLATQRAQTRFLFVTNLLTAASSSSCDNDDDENDTVAAAAEPGVVWDEPWVVAEAIRSVMDGYDTTGDGVEVFCAQDKKKLATACHVGFRNARDAQTALTRLQEARVTWTWTDPVQQQQRVHRASSGTLFLDYAAVTERSRKRAQFRDAGGVDVPKRGEPPRSECTSTTDHVRVPGLLLVPDVITAEEEDILLALVLGPQAPWAPAQRTPTQGGAVKRRVQHYGYVFDYHTADVLRDKTADPTANCPPMPQWSSSSENEIKDTSASLEEALAQLVDEGRSWPVLAGIIERIRQTKFEIEGQTLQFPTINQMTLNHYEPGEGIGSHVDTPSAFGDGLLSLSLQSGIVMEFRLPGTDQRKLLYLPPRSLVVMTGPARYHWVHHIVTRRTDTHNGKVIPRGVRVSLTFRTALNDDGTRLPLLESKDFPLRWGQGNSKSDPSYENTTSSSLVTPECERRHVHEVYDAIARQWHHTRGRRGVLWPGATQFLQRLPPGSIVADVGCGDGKYFPAIWEAGSFVIGTDISRPLLQTAFPDESDIPENHLPESRRISDDKRHLRGRPAVAVADCMNLPLQDHSCDAAICIAVLHHLSTLERRVQCLRELARVVRVGGLINVQAWALDQEEGSRRKFATDDVFVPFNAQPKYLELQITSNGTDGDAPDVKPDDRSTAQVYSEAFNAQYDDRKGLVVFKRYCHLYRKGELEELVEGVPNLELVESGFESGNYFIILLVTSESLVAE